MRVCAFLLLLCLASHSQAQEPCVRAQAIIAETSLLPSVEVHSNWHDFVESKPSDKPFRVEQYASSHLPGKAAPLTVVSCKMRTAERINSSHYDEGSDTPPAGSESSCDQVHRQFLDEVYASVPSSDQLIARSRWLVAEEELTFMGPDWLEPWPFIPLTLLPDARLQLNTRALYVPHAWWIPMPERFLGNYYCHLAAPSFLESLVRGELAVPEAQ